jgi:hypothetical protein
MTNLPRRFEFDCHEFGQGWLYVVDLDVVNKAGYVEIKYSPNNPQYSKCPEEVFWVETESELAGLIEKGVRKITQVFSESPNIEDLI